jgi:hypothetical protein
MAKLKSIFLIFFCCIQSKYLFPQRSSSIFLNFGLNNSTDLKKSNNDIFIGFNLRTQINKKIFISLNTNYSKNLYFDNINSTNPNHAIFNKNKNAISNSFIMGPEISYLLINKNRFNLFTASGINIKARVLKYPFYVNVYSIYREKLETFVVLPAKISCEYQIKKRYLIGVNYNSYIYFNQTTVFDQQLIFSLGYMLK